MNTELRVENHVCLSFSHESLYRCAIIIPSYLINKYIYILTPLSNLNILSMIFKLDYHYRLNGLSPKLLLSF